MPCIKKSRSKSGSINGPGFVTAKDVAEDMFMHSRILIDCGFSALIQGQKLLIEVYHACEGPCFQACHIMNE